jgi:tetratricopeptide (TPR) repeat protein
LGALGAALEIKCWDLATAAKFLTHRTMQSSPSAEILADELGALPLACEQAAAYIVATGISLSEYLKLFQAQRGELWSDEERQLRDLGEGVTVSTVWELSLAKIGESEPAAIDLLRLISFMAPEAIPLRVISQHGWMAAGLLPRAAGNALLLNRTISALRRYSLIDRLDVAVRAHRLLQAVISDRMDTAVQSQWIASAIRIAEAAFEFDNDNPETWPRAREILPHAVTAATWHSGDRTAKDRAVALVPDNETPLVAEELSRLLKKLGSYFRISSQYAAARRALGRALEIDRIRRTVDYKSLASTTIEFGQVLREQGDLQGSRQAQEHAIKICTSNDEFESRRISAALLNLGQVLRAEGNIVGAIGMFRKAMAVANKGQGKNDADLATTLNHYGEALAEHGDLDDAQEALQRALALDQATFGLSHQTVARDFLSLAKFLRLADKLDPAKRANERALKICESTYQAGHPAIADALIDYAETLVSDNKTAAARLKYDQALTIYEQSYGQEHVKYVDALYRVGLLEADMGEFDSSIARLELVRKAYAKFYGTSYVRVHDIDQRLRRLRQIES